MHVPLYAMGSVKVTQHRSHCIRAKEALGSGEPEQACSDLILYKSGTINIHNNLVLALYNLAVALVALAKTTVHCT